MEISIKGIKPYVLPVLASYFMGGGTVAGAVNLFIPGPEKPVVDSTATDSTVAKPEPHPICEKGLYAFIGPHGFECGMCYLRPD